MNPVSWPEATTVVGWALIHFVWQGILLAAALGLARLIVPRGFVRLRYAAGCVTLAAMLAAPALTAMSLAGAPVPVQTAVAIRNGGTHAAAGNRTAEPRAATIDGSRRFALPMPAASQLLPALVVAWVLGVLICAVRLAGGWWHARRLVRLDTRRAPEALDGMSRAIARRLGLSRAIRLLVSTRVQVPLVIGWLRPVLLVPAAVATGLPPRQLEAVLAHELAHVRRHDYLVNLLQAVAETLLFYHPAVWWVSHTVRVEREHCCDDLAVAACGDPIAYARALTAVESCRDDRAALALAASGGSLVARVRRLLGVAPPRHVSTSHWVVAALTALMVSGAGATNLLDDLTGFWRSGALAHQQPGPAAAPMDEPAAAAQPAPAPAETPEERGSAAATPRADVQQPERPAPAESSARTGDRAPTQADAEADRASREAMAHARRAVEEARRAAAEAMEEYRRALDVAHRARAEAMEQYRLALQEARRAGAEARSRIRSGYADHPDTWKLVQQAHELVRQTRMQAKEIARAAKRAAKRAQIEARREALRPRRSDPAMPPPPPAPPAPAPAVPSTPDVPPVPAVPPAPETPPAPVPPRSAVLPAPPAPPAPVPDVLAVVPEAPPPPVLPPPPPED